ncbi:MAG: universal stress protein [Betaproteobacteria bacterium]|nr:universal stress protein [Betaproteobacteria bacterium]
MNQFKHILAATDLSAPARHAAERAALIGRELGAPLDLLHIANLAPLEKLWQLMAADTSGTMQQQVLDAAREKLHELAAALMKRYGVAAGTHVVTGPLLAELGKQIDALNTNLLVCGAKGENVIRHMLLGSTAERILGSSSCPVLVVKQAPRDQYRTLLVPVDFSSSSLRAIQHAKAIAPTAAIVLLHAFEVPFEGHMRYANVDDDAIYHYRLMAKQAAMQKMHALSAEAGLPPQTTRLLVMHGDRVMRIVEQEQEQDCDLIVMGKRGESKLEEIFIGSTTKLILAESQSDVFVSV